MCFSQGEASDFTGNTSDRPRDPRADQMNFVPNEVLVKFKDDVSVPGGSSLKSAGITAVDRVLRANGVASLEKLFPTEMKLKSARIVKDPTGRDMKIPSLHNIYRITVPQLKSTNSAPADIFKFMEEMKALPEVEYAEPNYLFTIGDFTPASREMTMLEAMEQTANSELSTIATGLIPNDPLYNSQWGIPATNIDDVWNTTTGDSTSIIAILDTGVDWKHPDLAANIWKNKQEIPDNGRDDDINGLIDDIRGWDYINNDNNPMDDNSHGTHVAGIAAAVGNNGIGIAGANWRAKIMPIKVFQSSGKGDAATIAKGITYAASKGATVINMSFGSYARSLAMQDALASAYATAILVAAAGNDATPIGPCMGCAPMYPGAFSFVLGVEANKMVPAPCGVGDPIIRACFSNFDQDGPVFSQYADLLNYELKAPGTGILSCVPSGNYREYNGTSMAAPLVAGAVSLYRKQKPTESQELLFGNMINSLGQHFDLEAALTIIPEPKLDIVSYSVTDSIDGDKDGRPDAGETIELKVKVRNSWGQANDVKVGIEYGEFEDQTTATLLTPEVSIGAVSAYATKENKISIKLKLAANINDGRDIVFKLKTWYGDHLGEKDQTITINVENGVELKGVINQNMTLYPNKQYIITDNLAIAEGVTLTIKPGTILKFAEDKSMVIAGNVIAIGTRDSLITFTKRDLSSSWKGIKIGGTGNLRFKYGNFTYGGIFNNYPSEMLSSENYNVSSIISNIIFSCNFGYIFDLNQILFNRNIITNNAYSAGIIYYPGQAIISDNIIVNNKAFNYYYTNAALSFTNYEFLDDFTENSVFSNFNGGKIEMNIQAQNPKFLIKKLSPNYFGTTNGKKINAGIYDFEEDGSLPLFDISAKLNTPPRGNHGLVWKVLVNGKDAQDEYDLLDPWGVGKQKLEVYFNRAMDIKIPPTVSMGVRYPYSQTDIAEDGIWSADSTIYTTYGTVGLSTGDGINTIRVTGAKDMDHFEIPIEDRRFRVIVNAAGSLSEGFEATPGMGKVALEWTNPSEGVDDLLGYNIYRYTFLNDSVTSDTTMVNTAMINDTLFTDFEVEPATKYFYAYKTVRTNLTESDFSKVVAATPLTAAKGDANGDLAVNVLDITTIVAYLLNNNPQPFITEAADLNSDENINVLDIVSVVNLVLGNKSAVISTNEQVHLYMQNDSLFADAPIAVGGIQFDISGVTSVDEIQKLKALDGFESGYGVNEKGIRLLYYSLSGKSISAGTRIPLLRLKKGSGVSDAIFADKLGTSIPVNYNVTEVWNLSDKLSETVAELGQNFPNPLSLQTTIPIRIYEPVDEAVIRIVNMYGQTVEAMHVSNPTVGEHLVQWNSGANKGFFAYLLEIRRGKQQFICPVRKMIVQ